MTLPSIDCCKITFTDSIFSSVVFIHVNSHTAMREFLDPIFNKIRIIWVEVIGLSSPHYWEPKNVFFLRTLVIHEFPLDDSCVPDVQSSRGKGCCLIFELNQVMLRQDEISLLKVSIPSFPFQGRLHQNLVLFLAL